MSNGIPRWQARASERRLTARDVGDPAGANRPMDLDFAAFMGVFVLERYARLA